MLVGIKSEFSVKCFSSFFKVGTVKDKLWDIVEEEVCFECFCRCGVYAALFYKFADGLGVLLLFIQQLVLGGHYLQHKQLLLASVCQDN